MWVFKLPPSRILSLSYWPGGMFIIKSCELMFCAIPENFNFISIFIFCLWLKSMDFLGIQIFACRCIIKARHPSILLCPPFFLNQSENIHTPPPLTEGTGISWGWWLCKTNQNKKCIKLSWNFQKGGGSYKKPLHGQSTCMSIFWNHTCTGTW